MEEKELRGLLLQRFHMEYMVFKDSMLQKEKGDIFRDSYKIEIFVNLYEILLSYAEGLGCDAVRGLLKLNFGILDFLYQEWLRREDSFYEELRGYACSELRSVLEDSREDCGKDGRDGK